MQSSKDAIYSQPQQVSDFRFDDTVAEVFPDMIQRSVPGYNTIVDAIGQLAGRYATNNSNIYDLGCSLGAVSLAAAKYVVADNCSIIAIDNSEAMAQRCARHVKAYKANTPIKVICDDLQNIDIENASIVVMNFTLQFIEPALRDQIIQTIYDGLAPGGIFILSEKLRHVSEQGNELLIDLHHEFKRRNGYSELEISQKRESIENILRAETFEAHQTRLRNAGFDDVVLWFQCFNFASIVAIKN
ncbi:carboxy-S-adenosyl-L-methionine synthase CmoA [Paraglaciecola mesophila]|uniref:Carboxy-S-adenosyl-L-methionine synthase n=2 Tax=Paraglaciecola mesophila TaxID=197222 RepID=K6YZF2_9ALTE|nr:carboxy-S-adenosyl-L-methionine synthase CmoA [Paraglaciecola mesophila]GAC23547.1 tRNA (cmo5U34)-methyltransferase [Paraglaciecola mesophila KMM 241]|tara:strand:+ start:9695 stop:10426 length:732 start_codon:yes stop_codon:yes gene_type:complete